MRISDGSSDVCSSDLDDPSADRGDGRSGARPAARASRRGARKSLCARAGARFRIRDPRFGGAAERRGAASRRCLTEAADGRPSRKRSEEHTSELQSLMRNSYAVFCLKKKTTKRNKTKHTSNTT